MTRLVYLCKNLVSHQYFFFGIRTFLSHMTVVLKTFAKDM